VINLPWSSGLPTKAPRPLARWFRPSFEELEGRCLLSGGWLDLRLASAGILSTPLGLMPTQKEIDTADGKHLFVGTISYAWKWDFAVARTDANDQLDTTFGSGGIVATAVSSNGTDTAYDILIQPDGKIVLVGRAGYTLGGNGWLTSPGGFGLVRYNADGSLDTTFGTNGETITPIGGEAVAAALQTDGKIVVVGSSTQALGQSTAEFTVARYTPDGQLDSGFAESGVASLGFGGEDIADSVIIQPDGKIAVAGMSYSLFAEPTWSIYNPSFSNPVLARFNPDGNLDSGFGTDGTVFISSEFSTISGDGVSLGNDSAITVEVGPELSFFRFDADGFPVVAVAVPPPSSTSQHGYNGGSIAGERQQGDHQSTQAIQGMTTATPVMPGEGIDGPAGSALGQASRPLSGLSIDDGRSLLAAIQSVVNEDLTALAAVPTGSGPLRAMTPETHFSDTFWKRLLWVSGSATGTGFTGPTSQWATTLNDFQTTALASSSLLRDAMADWPQLESAVGFLVSLVVEFNPMP
jgi:uncharacterized delta-60 repeat protein